MSEERKEPIAVNGEVVAEALVQQELAMLRERYARHMSPDEMELRREKILSDARENAVERVLLMQQARVEIVSVRPGEVDARFMALQAQHGGEEAFRQRFETTAEDEARLRAELEDGIRLEKYFELLCKDVPRPTEADARAYYDAHPDEFTVPEMVHAAHIVRQPGPGRPVERIYADLMNVRERLARGEEFFELAEELSDCRDGGHDLGYFPRGQMVRAFEERAFSTPAGGVSDVFQTEFGYHVLTVFDHAEKKCREFKEVRYDIESSLFEARKNDAIGAVADGLRAKADIRNLVVVDG